MKGGLKYIRDYYDVPAKRGGRVRIYPRKGRFEAGTITGASENGRLLVRLDGCRYSLSYHPRGPIVYLDAEGAVMADMRKGGAE